MSQIEQQVDLKQYTTMHVSAKAAYFVVVKTISDLKNALAFAQKNQLPFKVLGGGSNLLFVADFNGLIIKNELKGTEIIFEDEHEVHLKIGAGENWHELVTFCVQNGWGGIENLALIPGTVGAAPVQNIGAYGVELNDVFISADVFLTETNTVEVMKEEECAFGYRESIFKHTLKDKAVVLNVHLRLQKNATPNVGYKALNDELLARGISNPAIKDVANAVIAVRQSKLPDPLQIGNNGSFFKNPVISTAQFTVLKQSHPTVPSYPISNAEVKVPAGWLIDQAGWKGHREGDAGVYPKQALILVNYGQATGSQILALSKKIQVDVHTKFNIEITPEVHILPNPDQ